MVARRADRAIPRKGRQNADAAASRRRTPDTEPMIGQHIWLGASGTLYPHAVASLIFCPPMSQSTYVLVQRDADGAARVLRVGTLEHKAASLNLATIRQLGATLGANEVHIREMGRSAADRARVVFDIEHALAGVDSILRAAPEARKEHRLA